MSLNNLKMKNKIKLNLTNPEFYKKNMFSLSPTFLNLNNNEYYIQSNSIKNSQINSLSSRSKKYSNNYIFMKREKMFNKSLEENKTIFKYHKYSLFNKKKKLITQKKSMNKNLIKSKSSLYLTESIIKTKNYFFPNINQDNSNTI